MGQKLNNNMTSEEVNAFIYSSALDGQYSQDEADDALLKEIKGICLSYIQNPDNVTSTDEEIIAAYNFLVQKVEQITELKTKLKIKNYSWPFTEISQAMDEYLMSSDLNTRTFGTIQLKLAREMSYLIDLLHFTFLTIQKIMTERELFAE